MKKIYSILFIIMFSVFNAQIVNIPDPNLKAKLLTYGSTYDSAGTIINVDTNGDGEIQISEAQMVSKIILYMDNTITNLSGLEFFPLLIELEVSNPNLPTSTLIFSNYPSLQKLKILGGTVYNVNVENINSLFSVNTVLAGNSFNIQNTSVQEIDIYGNISSANITSSPNLKKLALSGTSINSLDISNLPLLEEVKVINNVSLSNINFTADNALKKVSVANNHLSSMTIPNPSIVSQLDIVGNLFQTFDAIPYTGLTNFAANQNQITNLDFSSNPLLNELSLSNNALTSLIFNNNTHLEYLYVANNQLQNLSFNQLPALKSFQCANNLFTDLDFTQNFQLLSFDCSNNPNLLTLLMKNGKDNYSGPASGFSFSNTPMLKYICIDPSEIYMLNALLTQYNQLNVVVNSYCTFTPGGVYYTIQGVTRYDLNGNSCDNNDPTKSFQKFNVFDMSSGQSTAISNISGSYFLPVSAGNTSITPILENPSYFSVTPPSVTVSFPNQVSPLNQNFCLTANGTHNDLEISIIPITTARPGFDSKYKIVYKNKGTTTQSGTLVYNFNANLMNLLNSTITPNSQSPGILSWNFANLLPFETKEITATFKLNTPTQTPPLNGGDVLHYTAQINGATDDTPTDNIFTLNQTVVNSFDPNDKTCLEGSSITQAKVGDYVHYLIRFENTGTANAKNIVVKDEIDTSKFDISSLVSLNGSHNFVTRITSPNIVEFIFENIQLPFDDANNDGYVSFKIKTKSNLFIGDSFSNTAKIYFDYNAPIITNTSTTTVQNTLGISEINDDNAQFSIYPNPVKDVLFIKSKEKIIKAEIYDNVGRILSSASVTDNSITISELTRGNYILKLFTKDKSIIQKFIKN